MEEEHSERKLAVIRCASVLFGIMKRYFFSLFFLWRPLNADGALEGKKALGVHCSKPIKYWMLRGRTVVPRVFSHNSRLFSGRVQEDKQSVCIVLLSIINAFKWVPCYYIVC